MSLPPAQLTIVILVSACAAFMVIERLGAPVTLALTFKGDVKRETRWFAQYGQAACTIVAVLLVWRLDAAEQAHRVWQITVAVVGASVGAMLIKRMVGRVRPGRPNAGRFLGPTLTHANFRESFPSSHSACAVALTVALSTLYPAGAIIFWPLALICALLRYLMDAHWPSDIFGGIALGYAAALLTFRLIP